MSNLLLVLIVFAILLPSAVPQGRQGVRTLIALAIATLAATVVMIKYGG